MEIKLLFVVLFIIYQNASCFTNEKRLEEIHHSLRVLHRKFEMYERRIIDMETSLSVCFLELTTSIQKLELLLLDKSRLSRSRRDTDLSERVWEIEEPSDVDQNSRENDINYPPTASSCSAETSFGSKQSSLILDRLAYISDQITTSTLYFACKQDGRSECRPLLKPKSCTEIKNFNTESGDTFYDIYPIDQRDPIKVYCDMDGWTVIQKNSKDGHLFNRTWNEYKVGFGKPDNDYWIGNDKLHLLTKQKPVDLRLDMWSQGINNVNHYRLELEAVQIDSEENYYRLYFKKGISNMATDTYFFNNTKFSTSDRDRACRGCAVHGGWWYKNNATLSANKALQGFQSVIKIREKSL